MLENLEPPPRRNADWFDENNESIQSLLHEEQLQEMKCSTQVSAPKLQNLRNVKEKFNLLLGR